MQFVVLVLQRLAMVVVGWLAGYFAQKVPGLSVDHATQVAQLIVDNFWSIVFAVAMAGWTWFKRPGDVPAGQAPPAPKAG